MGGEKRKRGSNGVFFLTSVADYMCYAYQRLTCGLSVPNALMAVPARR
jgi:hypothetical protein